jgi:hypothetical protein
MGFESCEATAGGATSASPASTAFVGLSAGITQGINQQMGMNLFFVRFRRFFVNLFGF